MDDKITLEEIKNIRAFKVDLFNLYWERFGTFYLHVLPHAKLSIGKRGLVGEEKESGIILVFGPKAVRNVHINDIELYAELQFGYSWESITIPWDAIFRIYDKGQSSLVQLRIHSQVDEIEEAALKAKSSSPSKKSSVEKTGKKGKDGNVIQVDFGGKKD
jgi:hypothetical protein